MYPPPYYINNDQSFIEATIKENSFALMSTAFDGDILGTHLQFVYQPSEGQKGTLYGHFAKSNPQVKHIEQGALGLVTFSGPHGYVSANWYERPQKNVPTWNYVSVQAKGRPKILPQEQWAFEMEKLVQAYEGGESWKISDAQDYANALMHGIVYFKMEIDALQGIEKMSQNKSHSEKQTIISELRARKDNILADAVAKAMKP